ncbi:MAG TPA: serine hydrolase, partial [Rhizomicrobium sp.]|nr:serine hydrolase [Rhizomicrobium sp.]
MKRTLLTLLLCLLIGPAAAAGNASPADALVGLWKARLLLGPVARGPLIVEKSGSAYTADMMGKIVPMRFEADELVFDLPDRQGTFRGKFDGRGALRGHWFPPGPQGQQYSHAAPVVLMSSGKDRWQGEVVPAEDTFTFHLLVQKQPDGSLSALLRNPERDVGAQLGVSRIVREGDVVKLLSDKGRVVSAGAYDAEADAIILPFFNRGGTFDFYRDGDDSDFYARGRHPAPYAYRPPLARDDGWPTATLEDVGIDRSGIEKLVRTVIDLPMEKPDTPKIHSLMIARHGKLVLEEYFHGFSRDQLHDTRSAAKSVTAVIAGAAMQAGVPLKLSTPVYEAMNGGAFPSGLDPLKKTMTLEHLLTMSSGYFCDDTNDKAPGNEETMLDQTTEPDYYKFTLAIPLATPPGENAVYCSASPNLALGMVGKIAGENPLYLFDRLVAGPMQITHYGFGLDPVGHPYGGGGIEILPRDFMKFGQMMLNGGTWNGRRIVSREFAERATSSLYHLRGQTYGYLWWGLDYPYKNRIVHSFYAGGASGQVVVAFPELDLVIASFGGNYSSPGTFYSQRTL